MLFREERAFQKQLRAALVLQDGCHLTSEISLSCWLQIPFGYFVISTAIGLQPTNIVFVQAGASLSNLHSWRDLYGPRSIMLLTLCLLAALLPIFVRRHWLKVKPGAAPICLQPLPW